MGRDVQTKKRRRSPKVHAATESECWELLDSMREEYRKTGIVARRDITVAMVVQDVLDNPPADWHSPVTHAVYENFAQRIITAIGAVRLARLTAGQVDGMLRQMAREGCSRRTIVGTRSLLVRAIRRAERDGVVTRNVAALSDVPAAPGRVSKAMTLEQVGALLALDLTAWWRAFITVGVMTGLRPGELLGLRWEDADLDTGVLRVRQALKRGTGGKGRAGLAPGGLKTAQSRRTLNMPAPARSALAALRRQQAADRLRLGEFYTASGLVFADNAGRAVWPQQAARGFKDLCGKAGLGQDWQLRELRHTFVSQMSQAGVDLEVIADHVGHSNSNVTRGVYRHLLADKLGTAAAVFDNLYGTSS
jgi:integrase